MAKIQQTVNPAEAISAMRQDALLAYIEWPVWLHIRLKELNEALAITGQGTVPSAISPDVPPPAPVQPTQPSTQPSGGKPLGTKLKSRKDTQGDVDALLSQVFGDTQAGET